MVAVSAIVPATIFVAVFAVDVAIVVVVVSSHWAVHRSVH